MYKRLIGICVVFMTVTVSAFSQSMSYKQYVQMCISLVGIRERQIDMNVFVKQPQEKFGDYYSSQYKIFMEVDSGRVYRVTTFWFEDEAETITVLVGLVEIKNFL